MPGFRRRLSRRVGPGFGIDAADVLKACPLAVQWRSHSATRSSSSRHCSQSRTPSLSPGRSPGLSEADSSRGSESRHGLGLGLGTPSQSATQMLRLRPRAGHQIASAAGATRRSRPTVTQSTADSDSERPPAGTRASGVTPGPGSTEFARGQRSRRGKPRRRRRLLSHCQ